HPLAGKDLQHLVIGRHVVRREEGLAGDRDQLRIEEVRSDPIGASVTFVSVIGPQDAFENRLELSLSARAKRFMSTRGHALHFDRSPRSVTAFVSRKPTEAVTTAIHNKSSIKPADLPIADV